GWGLGHCDSALKLHPWLQIVDSKLLAIDCDPGALWNISDMADSPILHLHDQVVAGNVDDFAAFDSDLLRMGTLRCTGFCLHLCAQAHREGQEHRPHCKH